MTVLLWIERLGFNILLVIDMIGNMALLGRPGETISHRVARMRAYGGAPWGGVGCVLCRMLSGLFFFMHRDHCEWAMDDQDRAGSELWRWSK